jgi:CRP/FNR family cyclic AMP-dependent transcriptional regulator
MGQPIAAPPGAWRPRPIRAFDAGEEILAEGGAPDALHVIWSGRTAAYVVDPEMGRQLVFSIMGPGEVFGELALLSSGGERSASVKALEPTTTLTIARPEFERLRQRHREVDDLLIEVLRERAMRLSALLHEAVYLDAGRRVMAALAELAGHGERPPVVPLSQEELADLAGTSRETVSRVLGDAKRSGRLRTGTRRIVLLANPPPGRRRSRPSRDFRPAFAALLDLPWAPAAAPAPTPDPLDLLSGCGAARRRSFAAGEVVFHEGDAADALHVIVSGHAASTVGGPMQKSLIFAVMGEGEIFGELGILLRGGRRTATVRALEATQTLCVRRRDFHRLRRRDRRLDDLLIQALRRRVLRLSDRLFEARHREVEVRVRRRLIELAHLYGGGRDGTVVPLPQRDLAALVGASRATINPFLTAEASAGTISIAPRSITIRDVRGLAARAGLTRGLTR